MSTLYFFHQHVPLIPSSDYGIKFTLQNDLFLTFQYSLTIMVHAGVNLICAKDRLFSLFENYQHLIYMTTELYMHNKLGIHCKNLTETNEHWES